MDIQPFLQTLYQQYSELLKQKEINTTEAKIIGTNLSKIEELIRINNGKIPDNSSAQGSFIAPVPAPPTEYQMCFTWEARIKYALKQLNKAATSKQIAEYIKDIDSTRANADKSVELTASKMYKDGLLEAKKDGVKNYYSLPKS